MRSSYTMHTTWKLERVQDKPLRPARNDEEFQLHKAALEWGLADPLVIQSPEDFQSRPRWEGRLEPYHHQVRNLITFCRRLPVTLLADDVGLGKTISAGLILCELMARRKVGRALVICPKILGPQWAEELWSKFGIQARFATGDQLADELDHGSPVVITTYESATGRLADAATVSFDMLVLDEAHKLRNLYGGQKPPKMATVIRGTLERRLFKYVLMLTATPIQNRVWDLYSLIDCLAVTRGHRNPLGPPDAFRGRFIKPGSDGRKLVHARAEEFRRVLRQYVVRTRRGDAKLLFPSRVVELRPVALTPEEKALLKLVSSRIGHLNPLAQSSVAQAMMSSPAALATQLENMARKDTALAGAAGEARRLSGSCARPAKLELLLTVCGKLRTEKSDWRVVVFTHRSETQGVIGEALAAQGIPAGFIRGGQALTNQRAIEDFRESPPRVHVIVSTDAGAEGINLQAGNVLVNYDLPWNPMKVEQRIGRVQRLSSVHRHVVILNLVAAGTAEEAVVGRLAEKLQTVAESIGDIESILESVDQGRDDADGEEVPFERALRELVVRSLLGQDVELARRKELDSIEAARRAIDAERAELDRALGGLDHLHVAGPRMPRLERADPSVPAPEFVLRAKRVEGASVRETHFGVFTVTAPNREAELITFDEARAEASSAQAVFMGRLRLYQPGKRDFERLVQHWVDRCGHRVLDSRPRTQATAGELAARWCADLPGAELLSFDLGERKPKFQGRVVARAKASNGVDSYEKLISADYRPPSHDPVEADPDAAPDEAEIVPGGFLRGYDVPLRQAVEADPEIGEFHRFYAERLAEELAQAGNDQRLRHKVHEDFRVDVHAETVALEGVRYDEVTLRVAFSLQGEGEYEAVLRAVPASDQVLDEPARAGCASTGLTVPVGCLDQCCLTGKTVLKHLLEASASGRRALRDRLVTCQVSGQRVIEDEVASSAVSGVVARRSEFVRCQESGDFVLPGEAGTSAMSGKVVRGDLLSPSEKPPHRLGLPTEFGTCDVTGRRLLRDELGTSAVSGRAADLELLQPSDRTGKPALAEEMVTCEESGVRLLPAETGACELTGRRVDAALLGRSEVSGVQALQTELTECPVTGKRVLPRELTECQVTGTRAADAAMEVCTVTGKRGLRSELVVCESTGEWVLRSEAGTSDYSGKTVARRLLVGSDVPPGRLGLREETGRCSVSGRLLLLDELARSAVSGRIAGRDLLRRSAASGAWALPVEMLTCAESGVELLPSETVACQITGGTVDIRLTSPSALSGRPGLTRLLDRCAVTGDSVLPAELAACEATGARVVPDHLGRCAATGLRVLRSRLVTCEYSGASILDTETARSDLSGRRVRASLLVRSELPPRRAGVPGETVRCEVTGRLLLRDEAGVSVVSGRRAGRDLLAGSDASGQLALVDELVYCPESGARLLPAEVARCSETGVLVDRRRLATHDLTGRAVLTRLTGECAHTGKRVLLKELESCAITGLRVLPSELATCAITGTRGLRARMARSDVSGQYAIPDETFRSPVSGRVALSDEGVRCTWLGESVLRKEAARCTLTGRTMAKNLLNEDGQLALLADLLDGRSAVARNGLDLIPVLRPLDKDLAGVTSAQIVRSPCGLLAVCGEVRTRGWFGEKVRYVGLLLRVGDRPAVIGSGVRGYRGSDAEFVIEDELEFG